jgi:preprotein translocase subunit SecA
MRKNLVEYDDVVNRQRETVYGERRDILKGSSANLEAQIESYFAHEIEALLDRYLDGFLPWMQSQINEAVQEHSNLETGRVNVNGLIARLRGILPQIYSLDREQLAEMDGERVGEELYHLAEAAHTQNHHIRLLAQEVTRFIPLWPALPDMRGVRDYGQRLKAEQQYRTDVQNVFDGLVTEEAKGVDRAQLWATTDNAIADAFRNFAVENVSAQERRKRFEARAVNLNNAVGQMLLAVLTALDREQLEAALLDRAAQMLEKWRELIGTDDLRTYEQWLFLSTIDREWQQYLEAIDDLRQGIGLEAFGQRDPKIEYKRRALDMFEELRDSVRHTIVDNFFRQLPDHQRFIEARRANAALRERAAQANYRIEQRKRGMTMRRDVQKVNRNDPCPCGSGKKYKNCHGRLGTQPTAEASMTDQPTAGQGKQRK